MTERCNHTPGGITEETVRGVEFENTNCTKCGARGNRVKGASHWNWAG